MLDTSIVLGQAAQSNGAQEVVAQFSTGEEYGGDLPEGLAQRGAPSTRSSRRYDADGTLEALTEKWLAPVFGGDPTDIPFITP